MKILIAIDSGDEDVEIGFALVCGSDETNYCRRCGPIPWMMLATCVSRADRNLGNYVS